MLSHFIIRLCSVVPTELNAKMRMEKKTGNLGCFVCPLPVFFFAQLPTIFGNITYFVSLSSFSDIDNLAIKSRLDCA